MTTCPQKERTAFDLDQVACALDGPYGRQRADLRNDRISNVRGSGTQDCSPERRAYLLSQLDQAAMWAKPEVSGDRCAGEQVETGRR